jgi:hypothetical protein
LEKQYIENQPRFGRSDMRTNLLTSLVCLIAFLGAASTAQAGGFQTDYKLCANSNQSKMIWKYHNQRCPKGMHAVQDIQVTNGGVNAGQTDYTTVQAACPKGSYEDGGICWDNQTDDYVGEAQDFGGGTTAAAPQHEGVCPNDSALRGNVCIKEVSQGTVAVALAKIRHLELIAYLLAALGAITMIGFLYYWFGPEELPSLSRGRRKGYADNGLPAHESGLQGSSPTNIFAVDE